jgi:hypothetical protein
LLDVILNQNPITINSTNFCSYWRWDKEMWWQLETLIEASDAWAPQKWLNQVFLSTLFAKTNRRLHYVEKGTSAYSFLQPYSRFNKHLLKSKLILTLLRHEIYFSNEGSRSKNK